MNIYEFQEQIESSLLLMDHFFFFLIHLEPLNWTPCYGA